LNRYFYTLVLVNDPNQTLKTLPNYKVKNLYIYTIVVTENIKTKKDRKYLNAEISWIPSTPKNELTHFKIIFTDKNNNNYNNKILNT
jgi:hypothetical protein